jgi:hypothetical protein
MQANRFVRYKMNQNGEDIAEKIKRTRDGELEGLDDTVGTAELVGLVVGASIMSMPRSSSSQKLRKEEKNVRWGLHLTESRELTVPFRRRLGISSKF